MQRQSWHLNLSLLLPRWVLHIKGAVVAAPPFLSHYTENRLTFPTAGFSPGWGIPAPVNPNMNSHQWVKHFAWGDVGQIFISRKCNYKPELLWGAIKGQTNISSLEHLPKAQEHIPPTWNPCLQSSVTQSLVPAGPKEARKEKFLRRIRICVRCKVQGDSVQTTNKYLQPDGLLWKQEGYFPLSAVPGW